MFRLLLHETQVVNLYTDVRQRYASKLPVKVRGGIHMCEGVLALSNLIGRFPEGGVIPPPYCDAFLSYD